MHARYSQSAHESWGGTQGTVLFVPFSFENETQETILTDSFYFENESQGTVLTDSFSMENESNRTVPCNSYAADSGKWDIQNRPNDIKLSPPVSKTIISYSIRGEISSDFFCFFTKKAWQSNQKMRRALINISFLEVLLCNIILLPPVRSGSPWSLRSTRSSLVKKRYLHPRTLLFPGQEK